MRQSSRAHNRTSQSYSRRLPRIGAVLAMLLGLPIPLLRTSSVYAASPTITSASFTDGGILKGTIYYAKSGATLTLTVTANTDTQCVVVTGGANPVSSPRQSPWTIPVTALSSSGPQTVSVTPRSNFNSQNNVCTGTPGTSVNVLYTLDNTGPMVTGSVSPAPNTAGWNNSNVTITWSASDAGSGVSTNCPTTTNPNPNPCTDSVTTETPLAGVAKTATASDNVGNSGIGSVTVKLDKTPPTISGAPDRAPNANGWYKAGVMISFTCGDALSGINSCSPSKNLSTDGANQSASGTAVDIAGNTAGTTVGNINIDQTPPTISGAPTTSPNGNGWYNGNVTVAWTCGDALSGIPTGACPANSTISGEGTGQTTTASVNDKAGNTTTATSNPAVKIDTTPPVTTASAPSTWTNTDVTITLASSDNLSGVASTNYILDGAAQQAGTSVSITTEGTHHLTYWSVDKAGNEESHHSVTILIDKSNPVITHTQNPVANGAGWNNGNVTVTFTCTDPLLADGTPGSGIASCTAPQTVMTEGKNQSVPGTATDNAGNMAADPATVSIDKSPPTITGAPDRAANGNGWYKADVTVTFTCNDQTTLSGIGSPGGCTTPVILGQGASQSVTGTALDAAGNSTSTVVGPLNIDETPPVLSGAPTTSPNTNGWYSGDVTVHWTCSDLLSGIAIGACPADTTVSGEGSNLSTTASVSDKAGNSTTTTIVGIKIDRTPPSTTSNAPAGWQNSDVVVNLSADDPLSGVGATYFTLDGSAPQQGTSLTIHADGTHTLTYWSVDNAGNLESAHTQTVMIDQTRPTIGHTQTPPVNDHNWNNTDVKVTFACADATSGVATCPAPQTVTAEGADQQVTGTAVDNAGNSADDVVFINIDKTPPTISAAADRTPNPNGWYDGNVTVSFTCGDALSGIADCPAPVVLGEGSNQTVSGTATDAAGNSATATIHGINVDKTAPLLSAAPTTDPNSNGWYKGDVIMHWTCSDPTLADGSAGSGIDGACPGDSTIVGEGDNLSATASVSDKAGNPTTTTSPIVKIDRTAPTTDASAPSAWTNNNVTVTLSAQDSLSGVVATYFILDGGAQLTGTSVSITTEGTHSLEYWSVDNAGNEEVHKTIQIKIDKTAPVITDSQLPAANANHWNMTDVTVTFSCTDPLLTDGTPGSGIASCTAPQTVTTEGQNQPVLGTATDNAGNMASDTAHVNLDKTPPTISGAPDRLANANGWYKSGVTVTFSCADQALLSGIDTCTAPVTLGEGGNQHVTGAAVDAAGNSTSITVSGINIDETAPTLSGTTTTSPNGAGWYSGDVTIHWNCADTLSGIAVDACPADSTITGEGTSLSTGASVSDLAGNMTAATSPAVKIDRTPPTTTATAPTGWQNRAVTVLLSAGDNLSGVAATYYTVDGGSPQAGTTILVSAEGTHTLSFWSVDNAGNVETPHSVTVLIDLTPPTISHAQVPVPNEHGWNNTPVTVSFTCADQPTLSGLASCTAPITVATDGKDQTVGGLATDNAGNSTPDSALVSIDTVPPTIGAAADRLPNGNGWYNDNVTVNFTCADDLSGVADCPAAQILSEGADQSASGTATDNAGNHADAKVSAINIDETAPLLSGAPTASPNSEDWYNTDVTITWACGDPLLADGKAGSGIDGNCPADSTISGEGKNLTTSATIADRAGNSTTASSQAVNIDRTPPSTDISAPSAWTNTDVTVTLTPGDNLSGVAATHYTLDGGAQQTGTSVAITTEGTHHLTYWSVDKAGNEESHKTVTILIDKSNPIISHTQDPVANGDGWNRTNVTVTFTCTDPALIDGTPGSGIASCTAPQTVTTEGLKQPVPGTAVDNAGNTAIDPATVSIDKTPPTISGAPDRAPNGNGWYRDDVTVNFLCADGLSGVKTCSDPTTFGEGANQQVTGTAVDAAGNSTSATVSGINVDKTPPTLSGAPTTSANGAGWYNGDVTIHWTCGDALSGIPTGACPTDSTISGEGETLSTTASVSDNADNSTTATSPTVKIDRTPPHTLPTAPAGWQNSDVVVTLTPSDNLSGVATTYYTVDGGNQQTGTSIPINSEGTHTISFWSVDNADNVEAPQTVTVLIDKTPPTISDSKDPAPNANGWNNMPVTVSFHCDDQATLSGVASCTAPQTVTTEGQGQPVLGTAVDNAGNPNTDLATVNIDKTPPTISGTPDRAANGNNWYRDNVTVSFTCADALSGVSACSAPVNLGEGGNQSVTGTATDLAGNQAGATVSGINIDKTPPLLSALPTTGPNANGWYKGDVIMHWTCSDPTLADGSDGSGIDGACPADSTITGEGASLSTTASVSDKAGNPTTAASPAVKIDRTAPTTDATAPTAWTNNNVTVTLTAQDGLSGVAATYYSLDGGTQQTGTSVPITTEGTHTLSYWSADLAGNEEVHKTATIKIDKTAPTISDSQSPAANANHWNMTDVTVTFTCTDPALTDGTSSGIASCTAPQTVTTEAQSQPVLGTATDNAGNTGLDTAHVNIDKTPPTISGAPDRLANGADWYNANVTVNFTCADQALLSGIFTCTAPVKLGEGSSQSVTGTAFDAAGNSTSTMVSGINVDETAPTLSGAPTTSANGAGWYKGDVAIHWTCSDPKLADGSDGSGIAVGACPTDSTITGEGASLSTTASVSDKAGNSTTATSPAVKIDRTPPQTTDDTPQSWENTSVTVHLAATDNLSGVATTYYTVDGGIPQPGTSVTVTNEGTHTLSYWSGDVAGNTETHHTVTVLIDKTPPAISGAATTSPNANGWYNGPVTVHFTCGDPKLADGTPGSGVAACPPDVTLSSGGANQSVKGTATDNAGNTKSVTVSGINIDTTGPVIVINGVAAGGIYTLGAVPTPSCIATDPLSGLAGPCTGTVSGGLANGVGSFTYTAVATDRAGNITTVTTPYRVIYRFDGFLQPINDTAHQVGTSTSIFKAGSTIPVKFQLKKADGTVVQATTLPLWLTPVPGSSMAAAVNESAYAASSNSGSTYRWDGTGPQYIYNWGTPSSGSGRYWHIGVTLDDGQTYLVNIGLR